MTLKMKNKVIAFAMSLAMAFTMMPMMGATVYADDPAPAAPGIAQGSDVLSVGSNTSGAATVHMADKTWRVIGYDGSGVASSADTMTLIAADNLKTGVQFRANDTASDANHYSKSDLKTEVDAVANTFSAGEKAGIAARDLASGIHNGADTDCIAGDEVTGAILWPLSTKEANALNSDMRRLDGGSGHDWATDYWWLRSPGYFSRHAAYVRGDGYVDYNVYKVDKSFGLRPAFNYNLKSVIFTSAAVGGKSSYAVGPSSLKSVEPNTNNEWKMTVADTAHEDFAVDSVTTCDKKTLNIKYKNAVKGGNEYISAIIRDKDGNVKCYGNLKNCTEDTDASGTVKINVDGKLGTEDTLCIFNEQLNGDKKTDFASELKKIPIPTELHDWKAATCTEGKTCKECGETEGNALGHKYGEWKKLDANQHQRVCEHDKSHVEKANHSWDAGKVTKKATTTATGVKTYTCTVCKATKTQTIAKLAKKAANPLKIGAKTATVKYSKLKKKTQTLAVTKVIKFTKKGQGKMTYTLSTAKKGKKSFKKYFKINKTTGKVTVKKGLKKGTYKVKVKVKAAGNANYKPSAVKTVMFTVKVK